MNKAIFFQMEDNLNSSLTLFLLPILMYRSNFFFAVFGSV